MPLTKLEEGDYLLIMLGVLAMFVSVYRFIVFSGPANHFMSGFVALIGFFLFWMVYKKTKEEQETNLPFPPVQNILRPPPFSYPAPLCPYCGRPLTYIPEYSRWYCYNCENYAY